MMPLFQCQLCHSKVLENRLQKHHAKVHAGIDHDIYTSLITNDAPQVVRHVDSKASENSTQVNNSVADEKMVRVSCNICGNRMPVDSLDQHMKRKHNDDGDQVDAVGTKVNSMSVDVIEKSEDAKAATAAAVAAIDISNHFKKQSQEPTESWMTSSWPKAKNPFSSSVRFTAIPKTDASTMMIDEEPFYTIRVSVAQMKELMKENRIDPKDGHFYLK